MNKPRLWTKDFLAVSLVTLFLSLGFHITMVTISIYAMDVFQSSPGLAGLATGIFIFGGLIARIIFGRLIERIGRRKMLFAGIVLNLITIFLYFVADSYPLLLVVRFLHGASNGIAITVAVAIAANIIPNERRGEGMAYYMSLSSTLSAAIGPFLAIFTIQHGSYNLVFIFCVIFATLALIVAFILYIPEIKLTEEQIQQAKEFKLSRFVATRAIPISLICGIIYFCYSSVTTFLSPYAKEINLIEVASFFFIVYSIAIFISRPFIGRLFDSKGENIVMYPAILIFMGGIIILSQTYLGSTLLLAGALVGIGLGTIQSSCFAIATRVVPIHQTGLASSTVMMIMDIWGGSGPFVFGLIVPLIGYRGMYLVAAAIVLACTFLYYLLHGREAAQVKTGNKQET